MNRYTITPVKCLLVCIALCLLPIGPACAEDCVKARDIYAAGTKMLNFDDRAKAFQDAVNLCPSFAEAHCNLGDAFENLAKASQDNVKQLNRFLDMAVLQYREAIKCNKNLFAAYLGLGDTCRVTGSLATAEEAYKKALELRPGHPKASAGLEKIRIINSQDSGGFKKSEDIVKHYRGSSQETGLGSLMGFEGRTVVKDRLRFNNILFNEWSAELKRGEAIEQLGEIAKAISSPELAQCDFVVEGHTDSRGDSERNMQLSRDRSEGVRNYLIEQFNIDSNRIKTEGFGFSRPRFPNDTQENRLKNRRVEILFVEKTKR